METTKEKDERDAKDAKERERAKDREREAKERERAAKGDVKDAKDTKEAPVNTIPNEAFKRYRRLQFAEMADWTPELDMTTVAVHPADVAAGSPKEGDKIARNPANRQELWLVSAVYFGQNFDPGPA